MKREVEYENKGYIKTTDSGGIQEEAIYLKETSACDKRYNGENRSCRCMNLWQNHLIHMVMEMQVNI